MRLAIYKIKQFRIYNFEFLYFWSFIKLGDNFPRILITGLQSIVNTETPGPCFMLAIGITQSFLIKSRINLAPVISY